MGLWRSLVRWLSGRRESAVVPQPERKVLGSMDETVAQEESRSRPSLGSAFGENEDVLPMVKKQSHRNGEAYPGGRRVSVDIMAAQLSLGLGGGDASPSTEPTARAKLQFGHIDSQQAFADKQHTAIIFDWDDTLFPTAYIRMDMKFKMMLPLREQRVHNKVKEEAAANLLKCADCAIAILRIAHGLGEVVLVTLARAEWVREACRNFYPGVWEVLEELKVKVVYAQDDPSLDKSKTKDMSDEELEEFWCRAKGTAIGKELRRIYSKYPGQTWKNILSIGDSDFERLGTLSATKDYMQQLGIIKDDVVGVSSPLLTGEGVVGGRKKKVRTKTFKMVTQPSVDELAVEIDMCKQWLPLMVDFDAGFEIDLSCVEKPDDMERIEEKLHGSEEFAWPDTEELSESASDDDKGDLG